MSGNKDDKSFANHALALSVQNWMDLGQGQDPLTGTPDNIEEAALRITNIIIVRLIALHHSHRFEDLSTSTVAMTIMNSSDDSATFMEKITPSLILQLETYVTCMLYGYVNDLPFHNYQHAYHVCISANKFIESMLLSKSTRDTFGLASNPLYLVALLFAALIHDVGHTGVSNFQRAKDEQDMAESYQDSSIHEHHSLSLAFDELLKDEYEELRQVMFTESSQFEMFRQLVFEAVLSTDIANPARAEENKTKYFEAFPMAGSDGCEEDDNRRSSIASNISMPRAGNKDNRRASGHTVTSVSSDITMDSYSMMKHQNKVARTTGVKLQSGRRTSNSSGLASNGSGQSQPKRRLARRHSIETISSNFSEFAADSIRMTRERPNERRSSIGGPGVPQRRLSAGHCSDTGLAGMAQDLRRNMKANLETEISDVFEKEKKSSDGAPSSRLKRSNKHAKRSHSIDLVGAGVGGEPERDDDSSLSLTPPSSDDEFDGVVIHGTTGSPGSPRRLVNKMNGGGEAFDVLGRQTKFLTRRSSSAGGPSSTIRSIQEEENADEFSSANAEAGGELRAAVIIELCLRASDVAHWYQSWDTMTHFNSRIFQELCHACNGDRGFDPRPNWFDNQAKIMETYLLPLAEQIEYIGVLRKGSGIDLVASLESNNDLWLVRGFDVVETLKAEVDS